MIFICMSVPPVPPCYCASLLLRLPSIRVIHPITIMCRYFVPANAFAVTELRATALMLRQVYHYNIELPCQLPLLHCHVLS